MFRAKSKLLWIFVFVVETFFHCEIGFLSKLTYSWNYINFDDIFWKKPKYFSNDPLENSIWENEIKSQTKCTFEIKFFMCIYCFNLILCYVTSGIIFWGGFIEPSPLCLLSLHLSASLGNFICKHVLSYRLCTADSQIYLCAHNLPPLANFSSGLVSLSFHVGNRLSTQTQCGWDRSFNLPQFMATLLVPSLIMVDNLAALPVTQAHNLCVIFDSDPFSGPHIQAMA